MAEGSVSDGTVESVNMEVIHTDTQSRCLPVTNLIPSFWSLDLKGRPPENTGLSYIIDLFLWDTP